jgi:hypothetical protein
VNLHLFLVNSPDKINTALKDRRKRERWREMQRERGIEGGREREI